MDQQPFSNHQDFHIITKLQMLILDSPYNPYILSRAYDKYIYIDKIEISNIKVHLHSNV